MSKEDEPLISNSFDYENPFDHILLVSKIRTAVRTLAQAKGIEDISGHLYLYCDADCIVVTKRPEDLPPSDLIWSDYEDTDNDDQDYLT